MDKLFCNLGLKTMNDWYSVSTDKIYPIFGKQFREFWAEDRGYASTGDIIPTIYPEYHWIPWKFADLADDFWWREENLRSFMRKFADKYNVSF